MALTVIAVCLGVVPYLVMYAYEMGLSDIYNDYDFHSTRHPDPSDSVMAPFTPLLARLKAWRGDPDATLRLGLMHLKGLCPIAPSTFLRCRRAHWHPVPAQVRVRSSTKKKPIA